ncbi:MAG: T9SS type A sorting domain-containing protein [Bacteroidetes bacterium]|nr:T9SS type A sorting domain-containing protein [Bacteroidota bacterium]MCK5765531.1 T9SS type A sorting domain-containing protein [Bacteroidales bacterium]
MKKLITLLILALLTQTFVIAQPCLPSGITFTSQTEIDNFQTNHPNCTEIGGNLIVDSETISNLDGLSVVTLIEGKLKIIGCDILSSLTGLSNVTSLEGDLEIAGNDALFNLTGLEGLTSIGGNLDVRANSYLIDFTGLDNVNSIGGAVWIWLNYNLSSFAGLEKLTSIGDGLYIGIYGFPSGTWGNESLTKISQLSSLTSVSGDLQILGNNALSSLSGLDNINSNTIGNLTIAHNLSLTTCEVQSVCDYLDNPTGSTSILSNASGCGDQAEVEYACTLVGIADINLESEFSIYPNPADKNLFISSENGMIIDEVRIYNQIGQEVLHENQNTNKLDISMLQQGMYVVVLVSNNLNIRKKLIIR